MLRALTGALLVATALLFHTPSARAAGEEFSRQAADLVLTVDSRWAGCQYGGYYPLRIKVANRGLDCQLTLRFVGMNPGMIGGIPTVQRSLSVAANSTARLTLSVPCVGAGSYGTLSVYRDGRLIKQLTETLSLPDSQSYSLARPALLIVSPTNEDAGPFETAVTSGLGFGPSGGMSSYGYYGSASEDHQVVGPEMLPDSWTDYSGLDFVAIPLKTLGALSVEERAAILKWTHCGGTLIVYEVGQPAGESQELARLLELNALAAKSSAWVPADLRGRKVINIVDLSDTGGMGGMASMLIISESEADSNDNVPDFLWFETADAFAGRRLMLGHVYAFPENPFPGSPHDWSWFLKSVPQEHRTWTARHGISARWGSDEFLKFLIPSVRGIPVFAFLFLITVFTIVIGPMNYLWLWKKRRLYLLVLTIPVIALATSLALFSYSAIAHGFSTKSRARTWTLLDQPSNTAVSLSRIALYSGLAPSSGLGFSPETAVYPIWPEDSQFESGRVDWTDRQNLYGWLRSRTRTQFLTVSHRDERGRLRVSSPGTGQLRVENGLEWGLEALVVADEAGQLFYGKSIDAGASADLAPLSPEQRREFADLLREHPMAPPQTSSNSGGIFNSNLASMYMHGGSTPVRYELSLQEQQYNRLQKLRSPGGEFEPETYVAVVGENPGVELGIDNTRPQASLHVLMGRY